MASFCPTGYTDGTDRTAERERLILEHLPQVRWIALRMYEKLPPTFSLDDLISTGIIGLINAIDSYDPSFNAQLKTYAEYRIRGAILDSIRGLDGIPAHRRKQAKQVEATLSALEQKLGRAPTEDEVAAELKVSLDEYHEMLQDLRAVSIGSLDAPVANAEGGGTLMNFVADTDENSPARQIERAQLEKLISEGLSYLPEPERLVLSLYYKEGQNMREIAPIMNLHVTRVWQLKSQGILRLRAFMGKRWPTGRKGPFA